MSEILCALCNAQSPENAMYCQHCGQPIRCKECGTELLPTAHACIRCGKLILERSTAQQLPIGINTVPPGYNRLKLHETPDVRDIDLIVHNDAIEHIRDIFPSLVTNNRPDGRRTSSVEQPVRHQADVVEVPSALPAPQPQIAATSSQFTASVEGIWQIFRERDGGLKQERSDLKATNKRDYIIRLAYLYMFARYQKEDEKVPREDVFKILDEASVKDGHRSQYINASGIRTDENDNLWLTLEGRERAQQYLTEALDSRLPEGWPKGAESHPASNRAKKPAKKGNEQQSSSDSEIARWVASETTQEIVRTYPHSIIDTLDIQNMALFALYCLDKVGVTSEVQLSQISHFLFLAFQTQVDRHSLPKPLARSVDSKPALATYRKGSGYRITRSGIDHIEKLSSIK